MYRKILLSFYDKSCLDMMENIIIKKNIFMNFFPFTFLKLDIIIFIILL